MPEKPDPPQPLDFDDVVDDDSDAEPHAEAALAEAEAEVAMDAADDEHSSRLDQAHSEQNQIGFFCPFEECKPAAARCFGQNQVL